MGLVIMVKDSDSEVVIKIHICEPVNDVQKAIQAPHRKHCVMLTGQLFYPDVQQL